MHIENNPSWASWCLSLEDLSLISLATISTLCVPITNFCAGRASPTEILEFSSSAVAQTASSDMPSKREPPPPSDDDLAMADAPAESPVHEEEDPNPTNLAFNEDRIRIVGNPSGTAASFEFKKEDHTLGNALRYIIMKNPDVEFCGYSIPHPSEEIMTIRIQTYEGAVVDALKKGFDDLMDLCDVVADKFTAAREEFAEQQMQE